MADKISRETIGDESIDSDFVDKIVDAGADRIRTCIQCGTCSSVCPSGRRTAFRTRELMRKALLGLKDEVLSSPDLWLCATCLTCLERCPRQIKVTDAIIIMRNMAVEEGYMLPQHRKTSKKLLETGHAVPIDQANKDMRRELELQEIPPTVHSHEDALDDVKEIMKRTGFKKLIEEQEEES
ncbi:CoB--CoM heterodisulfide reductase subunit C [Candidatus Thorarchaeota archaeon]|jgi:heterodisulfide reductase subunit C|nr:MAG: CoB--CoM heterodisulfide reductase subunit C [Candidatus Thorarchaeota archaeon]